jgi:hypothetical protein
VLMGDKPAKYWDYRECAWVTCPVATDEVVVPAQEPRVEADDATAVGTAQ